VGAVYYPSLIKQNKYATTSKMTFENVVNKTLILDELEVRHDQTIAARYPSLVESGNAKLRAIYE